MAVARIREVSATLATLTLRPLNMNKNTPYKNTQLLLE
jgi:hypothetical protein